MSAHSFCLMHRRSPKSVWINPAYTSGEELEESAWKGNETLGLPQSRSAQQKAEASLLLGTSRACFRWWEGSEGPQGLSPLDLKGILQRLLPDFVRSGKVEADWPPSRRPDSRPAESSCCREVGEEVWPGCDDGGGGRKKPQRSGCSVKVAKMLRKNVRIKKTKKNQKSCWAERSKAAPC